MNVWFLLEAAFTMHPSRLAVTQGKESISYEELALRARRRALWIREHADGRPVIYVGQNRLEFIEILFGCVAAGVPLVPVNFRVTSTEYEHFLSVANARIVLAENRYHEVLRTAAGRVSGDVVVHRLEYGLGGKTLDVDSVEPAGTAVALFTSGTTSAPKLVRLTNANLSSYVIETVPAGSAGAEEATVLAAPAYHIAAVANTLTSIFRARRLVLLPQFSALGWLEAAKAEGATHAMVVPTMLSRILDALDENPSRTPSTLRVVAYGGAKAPEGLVRRALHALPGVDFVNAFGLTETSSTVALLGPADHRDAISSSDPVVQARLASVGRPVPGVEIQIRLEDGTEAPPNRAGQICIRGAQVAAGYVGGNLDLDSSGWLRTGDIGYFDEGGYLFISDRSDDIIIRGGENISPSEVEDIFRQHPAVRDIAVVGVPDLEWGEIVVAAYEGDPIPHEEFQEWAKDRLAGFKIPTTILNVSALPRNDMGKLVRRDVRARFE